ncbi:MAG: hypothetical protein AAF215_05180 [Cyanobacteria bacterium P01_A01_bin.123]
MTVLARYLSNGATQYLAIALGFQSVVADQELSLQELLFFARSVNAEMNPGIFNLHIPQGTDYTLAVTVTGGPSFRALATSAGTNQIQLIDQLSISLSTNDKVAFGNAIGTITADAGLGSKSLNISPLLFDIPRNTKGQKVSDVTGQTAEAKIYSDLGQTAVVTLTANLTDAPTDGLIRLSLSDAQTASLAANLPAGEFLTETEIQSRKYSGSEYLWQLELTDTNAITRRVLQGIVLVSPQGV